MKVSVLIVVHNAEKYISECIESVLSQTYTDFEVIIVDDGSTDHTTEIISKIKDPRFSIFYNNHDYISSLNYGIEKTNGIYIARMDADDIMLPTRLEEQVDIMESHMEVDICCTWVQTFGFCSDNISRGKNRIQVPLAELMIKNMFVHPSAMIKKSFLIKNKLKYKEYPFAEDYKLWVDAALNGGVFWVIPKILLNYRISNNQVSYKNFQEQKRTAIRIQNEALLAIINDTQVKEIKTLQYIYKKMEKLNHKGLLSSDSIRNIIYVLYKEVKAQNFG
ncbi:MAG: glycosyltransferase [Roseburia sp.]|nr:glycosyltransferase [Roseburia sp.]MCM1420459.1 glycosyltransferase [Bacteroides sp.]